MNTGWRRLHTLALALLTASAVSPALAQRPNERDARKAISVEDKSEDITSPESRIWVMKFRFKEPRLITVDVPGRGRKIFMYMWYQVVNDTKEARLFIPEFELVTLDKPGAYKDQVLPTVLEAIRKVEDPTGYLDIKNSVTISSQTIPVSKPDAAPRAVTGVAIWDDVNPDANRFSVFVSGLSNGWSVAEIPPDNKQVVRRKTLQLNFKRVGDRYYQHSGEIKFVPPEEWIYRASGVTLDAKGLPQSSATPKKDESTKAPGFRHPQPRTTTALEK
jgi:hypothetical protein